MCRSVFLGLTYLARLSSKAPVPPQYLGKQHVVFGAPYRKKLVVGTHYALGICDTDRFFESAQIDLPEGPLVHLHAGIHAIGLLGVDSEVLERGAYAFVFESLGHMPRDLARKHGKPCNLGIPVFPGHG